MTPHERASLRSWAARTSAAVCVRVLRTEGSVPREAGTVMLASATDIWGTVGGGHLEFDAIAHARSLLASAAGAPAEKRYALGPSLGQCCGGVVWLSFEHLDSVAIQNIALNPDNTLGYSLKSLKNKPQQQKQVALFGGGHVGQAIVRTLAHLPCAVRWIDSRDEIFPGHLAALADCEHSDPVQAAVADLAADSHVLIMSFSHAEDLEVVAACLARQRAKADLPFIGLIGSQTKWASFRQRLEQRGFTSSELSHVTCPIGLAGIVGKEPDLIALSVAAQLFSSHHTGA
jgi:xanthine dehydrogenase accessory factor